MNKERRKQIEEAKKVVSLVISDLEDSKEPTVLELCKTRLNAVKDDIDSIGDAEQEYADNMPEGLQGSDKHSEAESSAEALQEAEDLCQEVLEKLDETDNDDRFEEAESLCNDINDKLDEAAL